MKCCTHLHKNHILKRYMRIKKDEWKGENQGRYQEYYIMPLNRIRNCYINMDRSLEEARDGCFCFNHCNQSRDQVKEDEVGRACGTHGKGEKSKRFWWSSPKEGDHSEDRGVDWMMGSERSLGDWLRRVWSGFSWLRIGAGDGLLWMRWWTLGFCRHGVSNYMGIDETKSRK
jgi:hypothetical protein